METIEAEGGELNKPNEGISLYSGLALKKVLEENALMRFSATDSVRVSSRFAPSTILEREIRESSPPDILIAVRSTIERLVRDDILDQDSTAPFLKSGLGIAVSQGATHPRVDSESEFVRTLLSGRVAYSRAGASGIAFQKLLDQLGIADRVNEHAVVLEQGFTAEAVRDGRADIAIQQLSELAAVPETEIVGPFPDALQSYVVLDIAVRKRPHPATKDFIAILRDEDSQTAYAAARMEYEEP